MISSYTTKRDLTVQGPGTRRLLHPVRHALLLVVALPTPAGAWSTVTETSSIATLRPGCTMGGRTPLTATCGRPQRDVCRPPTTSLADSGTVG
jgi:hypothetical protein